MLNPETILYNCTLCPRECKINRYEKVGACGAGADILAALAGVHMWEEPPVSGTNGSGTVFFSGCTLKCVYCQNNEISHCGKGKIISVTRLAEIFLELQEKGVHNINLVTPTHFVPQIINALDIVKPRLKIPVVYNTSGYEKPETVKMLNGYVDVYLQDIKYFADEYAVKYSNAKKYFKYAVSSLCEMLNQHPKPVYSDGLIKKGVIVRHMVLPGAYKDSAKILEQLKKIANGEFVLSLMSQYTPVGISESYPELNRKITSFEYKKVVNKAIELKFENGFMQEKSSSTEDYIPSFNFEGL